MGQQSLWNIWHQLYGISKIYLYKSRIITGWVPSCRMFLVEKPWEIKDIIMNHHENIEIEASTIAFSSWWYICFDIQYQWQKTRIKHIRSKHCQWKKQWTSRTYKSISDKHLMKHIQTEGPSWKTWQTEHSWGSSSSIFIRRIQICHGQNMVCIGLLVYWLWSSHLEWDSTIPMAIWWYMNPKNLGDDHQAKRVKSVGFRPGFHPMFAHYKHIFHIGFDTSPFDVWRQHHLAFHGR